MDFAPELPNIATVDPWQPAGDDQPWEAARCWPQELPRLAARHLRG